MIIFIESNVWLTYPDSRLHLNDDSLEHDALSAATKFVPTDGGHSLGRCKYSLAADYITLVADTCNHSRSLAPQALFRTTQAL